MPLLDSIRPCAECAESTAHQRKRRSRSGFAVYAALALLPWLAWHEPNLAHLIGALVGAAVAGLHVLVDRAAPWECSRCLSRDHAGRRRRLRAWFGGRTIIDPL